jgi:FMN reductase
LGVAINSADRIWDDTGRLDDDTVSGQLDMLAMQLVAGSVRAAWRSAV